MKKEFILPNMRVSYFERIVIIADSTYVNGTENANYSTMQSFRTNKQTDTNTAKGGIEVNVLKAYDYN